MAFGGLGKGDEQAGQVARVFRIAKRIKQPGGEIGEEIKENSADDPAAEQSEKARTRAEAFAEPDDRGERDIVDKLGWAKGINSKGEPIVQVQRQIGDQQSSKRQPPLRRAREKCAGAECQRITHAEIGREDV